MPLQDLRRIHDNNPQLSTALAAVVLLVGLGLLLRQLLPGGDDPFVPGKAFYSSDDGATLFVASAENFPPFDHEGKTAHRVHVFTCDGGKTQIKGYLERLSPVGKEKMRALRESQKKNPGKLPGLDPELLANIEIKRPGDKAWIKQSDVAGASKIMDIRCPDKPDASADPLQP